tara:strand:+ start:762 stop:2645 length:1884 start_codon:yes stop_codon:yes gene_type:complete
MLYYLFLIISLSLLIYGFIVFWKDRHHFSFLYPNYWIFLIRPWKLVTFFLGTLIINFAIYLSYLSNYFIFIDLYLSTILCGLTFIFAPWCVGTIYRLFSIERSLNSDFFFVKHLTKELDTYLKKNKLSIIDALRKIENKIKGTKGTKYKNIISKIRRDLLQGVSLEKALSKHPYYFHQWYVEAISEAERTGNLINIFSEILKNINVNNYIITKTSIKEQIFNNKKFFVAIFLWLLITLFLYQYYMIFFYEFLLAPHISILDYIFMSVGIFTIKTIFFIYCGLIWNLDSRKNRRNGVGGITFAFQEIEWFTSNIDSSFKRIKWFFYLLSVPVAVMVIGICIQFAPLHLLDKYGIKISTPDGEYAINYSDKPIKFVQKLPIQEKDNNIDIPKINFGKYYALVIGNNNYQYWPKLETAVNDAEEIAEILETKYNFEVTLLLNQSHKKMKNAIFEMREKLTAYDNLLIYYAGHGELDTAEGRGYWLPVDADIKLRAEWINNTFILDQVKATKAKHVIVIVDSCFAGSLTRGAEKISSTNEITKLVPKKTRIIITSGGNEPVSDGGGENNHSVFAYGLIKTLQEINQVTLSNNIFPQIREYVLNNSEQTPEMSILTQAGHGGGDFIFVPANK